MHCSCHSTGDSSHDLSGRPKVVVGRLHLPKAERAQASINALALVGTPYDDAFLPDNSRLYCSELVVQSLDFIRGVGVDVPMQPMTFVDHIGGYLLTYNKAPEVWGALVAWK